MATPDPVAGSTQPGSPLTRALYALHLDPPLLLGIIALLGVGLMALYSAGGESLDLVLRQSLRVGVGLAAMVVVAQIPPPNLRLLAPWLFAAGTLALAAVDLWGASAGGAQRWLDLGFVRVQPSEGMKVVVPMMVARYLAERAPPPSWARALAALLLVAVPATLIARQPDLGTAVLVVSAGAFAIFLAGIRWRLIALFGALAAASVPLVWHFMRAYQRERVLTFLQPESDPLGAGYHIIQSKIAIGSGGLYGKGWLNGTQSQLDFLPERSTDFIFAVFGEEFGLFGSGLLLTLYALLIGRALYIAATAQDTFGRLFAGSLALTFSVYVVVNIGMVTGLMPVVGVPLPLISFGGTSMVTLLVAFGVIMSIRSHRRLLAP